MHFILMCTDDRIEIELVRREILTDNSEAQSESGNKVTKKGSKKGCSLYTCESSSTTAVKHHNLTSFCELHTHHCGPPVHGVVGRCIPISTHTGASMCAEVPGLTVTLVASSRHPVSPRS